MMDRHGRFLTAIPVVPVVALMLIGVGWFGFRMGRTARSAASESPSNPRSISRSDSDTVPPRLLPPGEMAPLATRLNSCRTAAGVNRPAAWSDEGLTLNPPELASPVEQGRQPVASATDGSAADEAPGAMGGLPARVDSNSGSQSASSMPETFPGTFNKESLGPASTPWATPYRPGERSEQLEQTARQADYHTRYGFDLASRKAYYAARSEFIRALRVVAQGLDSEHATGNHSRALSGGLAALEEVDDFVPAGSGLEADLDLDDIITSHSTPVLKLIDREHLTPVDAVRRYVQYAREQLALAAGGEVAGSMALHALAKLHWSLADRQHSGRPIDDTKAVALFEAAAQVCPENYLALNDLGVLLARGGRYEAAREALARSVAVSRDPTVRLNLAGVYRRMGDVAGAQRAEREAGSLLAAAGKAPRNSARPVPPVAWLTPQQFAGSYAATDGVWQPARVANQDPKATPSNAEAPAAKQASRGGAFDWFTKGWK